jgi:hypothetical protein
MSWFWQPLEEAGAALTTSDPYLTGASPPPHIRILVRQPRRIIVEDEQLPASILPIFEDDSYRPGSWTLRRVAPVVEQEELAFLYVEEETHRPTTWPLPRGWVYVEDEPFIPTIPPVGLEDDSFAARGWPSVPGRILVEPEDWPIEPFVDDLESWQPSRWPVVPGRIIVESEEWPAPSFGLADESTVLPGYRLRLRWMVLPGGFFNLERAPDPIEDESYQPPPPWPEYIIISDERPEPLPIMLRMDEHDPHPPQRPIPRFPYSLQRYWEDEIRSFAPTLGIEDQTWIAADRWPKWLAKIYQEDDHLWRQSIGVEDETWRPLVTQYYWTKILLQPEHMEGRVVPIRVDDDGDWFMQQSKQITYRPGWMVHLVQDDETDRGGFPPPPLTEVPFHWRLSRRGWRRRSW